MRPVTRRTERRMTGAQWASANPVLLEGEEGYDTTRDNFKIGDGVTAWNSLRYVMPFVATSAPAIAPAGSVWLKPVP